MAVASPGGAAGAATGAAAARPGASGLRWFWPWLAVVLGLGLAGVVVYSQALRVYLDDTETRARNTLLLANTSLAGYMNRFERLPPLLADQFIIRSLAAAPDDPPRIDAANVYLRAVAEQLEASDIYYMDRDGLTRAASNFDTATSFVGGNFAFRPYFSDAVTGGTGRFYALGTTSRKRGYYFGAPVWIRGGIAGVLVLKADLDAIEETWAAGDYALIVTDPEGVVFLSSREEWLFTMTAPLSPAQAETLARTRRYHTETLGIFPQEGESRIDDFRILSLAEQSGRRDFLILSEQMPAAGWTISVLQDTAAARRQALMLTIGAVLALGLAAMVVAVVLQRRGRLRDRLTMQAEAQAVLEARVIERTRELAAEVGERRQAEQHLRQAQADLVQAAKLAALGQMSAALSHEFNQPLGALRNYAENAEVLLDRGRTDEARGALARILAMVDRMAAIGGHLRSFARKPGQRLIPVDLTEVIEAAREIAELRLRAAGATLVVDLPPDLPRVIGGPVRLQQVLINLIANAADAVEGLEDRRIHLSAEAGAETVTIRLRDHGPGVPAAQVERIFDPFFSTKGVGNGLGLGLSISYNILRDFGGTLSYRPAEEGGAVFRVDLRRAPPDAAMMAAQ